MVAEFTDGAKPCPSQTKANMAELWTSPKLGWWKANCNAAFRDGKVVVSMVVKDDFDLLVEATSETFECSLAYEAEVQGLDRAIKHAASRGWSNIIFVSDAAMVVDDALSSKVPRGWNTSTSLRNIKL